MAQQFVDYATITLYNGGMGLTNKQAAFVREYLKDFNGTQAALRCGYSEKAARQIASENLTKPDIKAAIDEQIMSAEEAAMNITDIARGDMADLMYITPTGFHLELMKDGQVKTETKLIRKIKQKVTTFIAKKESDEDREVVETEIELYSRHEANRDILKYRGKLIDKSEVLNLAGGSIPLEQFEKNLLKAYGDSNGTTSPESEG